MTSTKTQQAVTAERVISETGANGLTLDKTTPEYLQLKSNFSENGYLNGGGGHSMYAKDVHEGQKTQSSSHLALSKTSGADEEFLAPVAATTPHSALLSAGMTRHQRCQYDRVKEIILTSMCEDCNTVLAEAVRKACDEHIRISLLLENCFYAAKSRNVVATLWSNLQEGFPDIDPVNYLVIASIMDDEHLKHFAMKRLSLDVDQSQTEGKYVQLGNWVQLENWTEKVSLTPMQAVHLGVAVQDVKLLKESVSNSLCAFWCGLTRDRNGESILHLAARVDSEECLQILLKGLDVGVDVDVPRKGDLRTPLMVASEYNCARMAHILVSKGGASISKRDATSENMTPLYIACVWGSIDVVEFMLECCSTEIWGSPFLRKHAQKGLYSACERGEQELVGYMAMKMKENIDYFDQETGLTPLMVTCRHGHPKAVQYLVENGEADVNATSQDDAGYTPLMLACMGGHFDVVQFLVEGTDAQVDYFALDGQSAHQIAIESTSPQIARYLEDVGRATR
eukprot:gb/GECG01003635.1/.p1 GENE.gb/GECG01003635.1/~~gb/GECG01003635.1/.p1  ORF type:complete len:511 (+),score=58.10 gb/GECG01003635.1/:1-1533(+)